MRRLKLLGKYLPGMAGRLMVRMPLCYTVKNDKKWNLKPYAGSVESDFELVITPYHLRFLVR